MWHEEDDTLRALIEKDKELYEESISGMKEWEVIGTGGYADAEDFLDQGRNCPYCAGILKFFEYTKKGNDIVYCADCHRRFNPKDINYRSETVDKLYKSINEREFNYWNDFLQKQHREERARGK